MQKRGVFRPPLLTVEYCQLNLLERSVFRLSRFRILADLKDALGFTILIRIRFRLETNGQLHTDKRLHEVEEFTRLLEVKLRAVGNFHTRGNDELVQPPIDGILVEQVILDLSVLAILEGD